MGKKYTESQKRASLKYDSKFKIIHLRISPKLKEDIQEICEKNNESVTSFCKRALINELENSKKVIQ